jgi:hypothetical protein
MSKPEIYRGFRIEGIFPPIPTRAHDYEYAHLDYDGPEDSRHGTCESVEACKADIDEKLDGGWPEAPWIPASWE